MNDGEQKKQCYIKRTFSTADAAQTVAAYARGAITAANLPQLAWAEPKPDWMANGKPGRCDAFRPLLIKPDSALTGWPSDLPLAEVRLFWENATLHIVANEQGGCRWAGIEELAKETGKQDDPDIICVSHETLPVYTLRDLKRFGLTHDASAPLPEKLNAITYHQQGRLVAWRLTGDQPNG
jgi:hypothetical protein